MSNPVDTLSLIPPFDATRLARRLEAAGIPIVSVKADKSIDFAEDATAEQETLAAQIVSAFEDSDTDMAIKERAAQEFRAASNLATVTQQQIKSWLDNNWKTAMDALKASVNALPNGTQKTIMLQQIEALDVLDIIIRQQSRALIALRNRAFPELEQPS